MRSVIAADSEEVDEITLLWGITPPANSQLIISRGPDAVWSIYLIDTDVPQPEPPDLAEWAICSATYLVGEEFMRPEDIGSDIPYSAAWGYFTPDVSPACPSPPETQVVTAQIIGAVIRSPDGPDPIATVDWFFSFAIGSQLDEWGADFVPPMTDREAIASILAWEIVFPLILDGSGGGGEGGDCLEALPKSINPNMAQNVFTCAPPIESSVDPCVRANQVCRKNATDTAKAAFLGCRDIFAAAIAGAVLGCAATCAGYAYPYGFLCGILCLPPLIASAVVVLKVCNRTATVALKVAGRDCALAYLECCEANNSCAPGRFDTGLHAPAKNGAQP